METIIHHDRCCSGTPCFLCCWKNTCCGNCGAVKIIIYHKKFPRKKLKIGCHTFQARKGVMAIIWSDNKEVKMLSSVCTSEIVDA